MPGFFLLRFLAGFARRADFGPSESRTFEALVDDALALAGFLEEIATRALACAVSPVARGVSPVARGVAITDGLQQSKKVAWISES